MPIRTHQELENAFSEDWLRRVLDYFRGSPDWNKISKHPCIIPDVVRAHPEHPWDDYGFLWNNNLPWDFLRERIRAAQARGSPHLWESKHVWEYLSEHPQVNLASTRDFPNAPWCWLDIFRNPTVSLEDLLEHCRTVSTEKVVSFDTAHRYVMTTAATNLNVPFEYRLDHPDIWWNFAEFSAEDPHIVEHVQRFPNLGWSSQQLSHNPHITLDLVRGTYEDPFEPVEVFDASGCPIVHNYPLPLVAFDWDWSALSENQAIRVQDMLEHRDLPWQWADASSNPTMTVEIVESHRELAWNGAKLSQNPGISLEAMLEKRYDWISWPHVSSHPDVGWDTIKAHPDVPWEEERLLANPMLRYKRAWMACEARRWCAARRLQRFARLITCNPLYPHAYKVRCAWLKEDGSSRSSSSSTTTWDIAA